MWFFRKKKAEKRDKIEQEIAAIHKDTYAKIDRAAKETKKLNDFIERQPSVTEMWFIATGGRRRK